MMRYFQKLIKRADLDIAYSEGFNPHQKMSFALPLGVGILSEGEYLDIIVNSTDSSKDAIKKLNSKNVEGISIQSYRLLPETADKAMASVAATSYLIELRDGYNIADIDFPTALTKFINSSKEINVLKKTKKSEVEMDLKPFIYDISSVKRKDYLDTDINVFDDYEYDMDKPCIYIKLAAGSVNNIKPDLVVDAFLKSKNIDVSPFSFEYTRLDVFGKNEDDVLIPLGDFGQDID